MSKYPTALTLTPEDRSMLESWVRAGKTERRLAERARMVLAAANGQSTIEIARTQRRRPATVSKWRVRFSQAGLTGLQDAPRPGAVPRYDENTRRRVLGTQGIHLQRRRSWCISTDPQFAAKAADIVALYLDPPEHAVILAVDEK